ncbi:MAG: DUF6624 domain-containing protein [Bacteroidia bacterium]
MKYYFFLLLTNITVTLFSQNLTIEDSYLFVLDKSNQNDTHNLKKHYVFLASKCHQKYKYYFELGKLTLSVPNLSKNYFKLAIKNNPESFYKIFSITKDSSYYQDYNNSLYKHSRIKVKDSVLQFSIKEMIVKDQFYRKKISEYSYLSNTNYSLFKIKFDSLMKLQKDYDYLNQVKLDSIINKKGWPDLRFVDEENLNSIFTISQHCINVNKRKKYLKLIEKSAKNGNDSYSHLAFYKDRTLMLQGKPQLFGTENIIKDNSGMQLYDIKNVEELNNRRIIYGLSPLKK